MISNLFIAHAGKVTSIDTILLVVVVKTWGNTFWK